MTDRYILNGHEAVPCEDPMEWARWYENFQNRRVARTKIGDIDISTVFLALDYSFGDAGPPVLFETMVFGLPEPSEDMDRCSTWAEAEAMHQRFVDKYAAAEDVISAEDRFHKWQRCPIGSCKRHKDCMYRPCRA